MATRLARQWWTQSNQETLLKSQDKLLSTLVKTKARYIDQDNDGTSLLNGVEFLAPAYESSEKVRELPTCVLAHGYGSGLGFFFRNIDPLLQSGKVGRVLTVDWLGMGGSDRPACRRPILRGWAQELSARVCDSRFTPSQAVDFFIDPLEEWLEQQQIDKDNRMWFVGHSLGGYLAARYALKYQDQGRISKLILASPVGFPMKPMDSLPESDLPGSLRLLDALWSSNVTPQQIVRIMGSSRGRQAVKKSLQGRIPHLSDHDISLLGDYLYHITVAHPSGEFAINSLLEPAASANSMGVYAREPLEEPLSTNLDSSMDLRILFGDKDWMRFNEDSARSVVRRLKIQNNMNASVHIIPKAGHHLYVDNAPEFMRHILE